MNAPFKQVERLGRLTTALGADVLAKLERLATPEIHLALVDGDLWIDFSGKPNETRLLSHLTTKKLGIGTLRNANTINGLAAMLGRS